MPRVANKIRIIIDTFADSDAQAAELAAEAGSLVRRTKEVEFVGYQERRAYRKNRTSLTEETTTDAAPEVRPDSV